MAPDYYIFTGRVGEVIPRHVTHVLIAEALNFIPEGAFYEHPNIEELICHDGVIKIEVAAFYECPRLRRVIMPGVKILEQGIFHDCEALTYVECGKLEIIGAGAFCCCSFLSSVDLPSVRIVETGAFHGCVSLSSVKIGNDLESIGKLAFRNCTSLAYIPFPLKDIMFAHDNIFQQCFKLNHIDLVGGVHETVDAFLLEEWKIDMSEEIDSINRILPNTPAGNAIDLGGKAQAIRTWIRSVLRKYNHYKAEHRRYVNEAASTLELAVPTDIVIKSILPFVELPREGLGGGKSNTIEDNSNTLK